MSLSKNSSQSYSDKIKQMYDSIWHTKTNHLKTNTNLMFKCFHSEIEEALYDYVNSKYYSFEGLIEKIRYVYTNMGFSIEQINEMINYHCLLPHDIEVVESMIVRILNEDYPIYEQNKLLENKERMIEAYYRVLDKQIYNILEEEKENEYDETDDDINRMDEYD